MCGIVGEIKRLMQNEYSRKKRCDNNNDNDMLNRLIQQDQMKINVYSTR